MLMQVILLKDSCRFILSLVNCIHQTIGEQAALALNVQCSYDVFTSNQKLISTINKKNILLSCFLIMNAL